MKVVVLGASGATGKLLVDQLLEIGGDVKLIVRASSAIPQSWNNNKQVEIIQSNIHEMTLEEMGGHLEDCNAVACCLGHTLSLKGIYGKPRKLVTNAVRLVCEAHQKNKHSKLLKIVLMNTAGNSNRGAKENISAGQKMIVAFIRLMLPPHRDNESAADYLRLNIGQNHPIIQWVVVRPDTLINEDTVTEYTIHPSPTRSAIFNPGKTSRINVGNFIARLLSEDALWQQWQGQMPIVYNK